jgi:4-hydroxyacetophenone monooxygenase
MLGGMGAGARARATARAASAQSSMGDAEIASAVAQAELPALIAALAMLLDDETLLREPLRPPAPFRNGTIAPQGGMSAEAQLAARELATEALSRYQAEGAPPPRDSSRLLRKTLEFLTNGASEENIQLMMRELGMSATEGPAERATAGEESEFEVAVIGAGIGGISASYHLQKAGIRHTVFDKNPEPGGVWWNNRYPGCRLDTPNFAYSLSFRPKSNWRQQFSTRADIFDYLNDVSRSIGLSERTEFNTEVIALQYDDESSRWSVTTVNETGEKNTRWFNAVIAAVGHLNRPSIPDFPGRELFRGLAVHSAEWQEGTNIRGKRVAVIGTGASAFQIVPSIVEEAAEVVVFQRTPSWMLPTPNYHDDLKPGMSLLLQEVPNYGLWYRMWQFWVAAEGRLLQTEVDPGWQHPTSISEQNEILRRLCMDNLERQLHDRPDLLKQLTPTYPPGAKRLMRDNGVWIGALKKPNVHLVAEAISHFERDAIVARSGARFEADVVVYATGFLASNYLEPLEIIGTGGRNLHEEWNGDARSYLGMMIPGFPNFFIMVGPNSTLPISGNAIVSNEICAEYAARALAYLARSGRNALDCRADVFEPYNRRLDEGNTRRAWGLPSVSTWYKGSSGRPCMPWPFSLLDFWLATRDFNPADFEFR